MSAPGFILRSRHLQWLLALVFPHLRAWPVREWPAVLGSANALEYDALERIGLLAGLGLVTWLLHQPDSVDAPVVLVFFTQMLLAAPLLLVVIGPLYLRRIRRGLQTLRDQQRSPPEDPHLEGK